MSMNKNLSRYRRNVVSYMGKIDENCPNGRLLEYILLSAHQNPELYEQFEHHFLVCEACQKRIRLIELFYVILDQEIRQPVSRVAVEMAQKLSEPQRA
jgi:hypothetical protein